MLTGLWSHRVEARERPRVAASRRMVRFVQHALPRSRAKQATLESVCLEFVDLGLEEKRCTALSEDSLSDESSHAAPPPPLAVPLIPRDAPLVPRPAAGEQRRERGFVKTTVPAAVSQQSLQLQPRLPVFGQGRESAYDEPDSDMNSSRPSVNDLVRESEEMTLVEFLEQARSAR